VIPTPAASADDPQLVKLLVTAVEEHLRDLGRPLDGTRLGVILGDAYRERRLPTGPGAYRAVVEAAVKQALLKKVWHETDRVRMALIPAASEIPVGWVGQPGPPRKTEQRATGLPPGTLYLRRDLFEAFAGLRTSVSIDLAHPPSATLGQNGEPITPLPAAAVVAAWDSFATEHELPGAARDQVQATLGKSATTAWGRIDVPGDNVGRRLGAKFHRTRLSVLVEYVRNWFTDRGNDPAAYELTSRRNRLQPTPPVIRRDGCAALRERLKQIIDRMSEEQLYQLRIPAEFLDL